MRRLLVTLAYGFAGIVLALTLSLGAFALAGREISDPAEPLASLTPALAPPSPRETPDGDRSAEKDDDRDDPRPTASASDDHRGDDGSNSGPGSDDGDDDNSGSGSDGGDNSGSGSDDSVDEHEDD